MSFGGFVPLDPETARALEDAAARLTDAERAMDRAARALLELAEDMSVEATRRLAERGASGAQIERYEEAYRASAESLRARGAALHEACGEMRAAVDRVRR